MMSWIGVALLSAVWAVGSGIHGPVFPGLVGLLFLSGTAAYVLGLRHVCGRLTSGAAVAWAVAAVAGLAAFWGVQAWGFAVILLATCAALGGVRWPALRRVVPGAWWAGLTYCAQGIAFSGVCQMMARFHELPGAGQVLAAVGGLLGFRASGIGPELVLPSPDLPLALAIGPEHAGLHFFVPFVVGGLILLLAGRALWWQYGMLGLTTAVYGLLRILFLAALEELLRERQMGLWWRPDFFLLSLAPLPVCLTRVCSPLSTAAPLWDLGGFSLRPALWMMPLTGSALAGCAAALPHLVHLPGTPKAGRVVVEEGHSEWETTLRKMDTEWFGDDSTYNYYCLYRHLQRFYPVRQHTAKTLTNADLKNCDVLIVKTPTRRFGASEIEAVVNFVAAGGGLWLIGDHTNFVGTGDYLNDLAAHFGIKFNYDSTHELSGGGLTFWHPPSKGAHPVVQTIPGLRFLTSCSLTARMACPAIIMAGGLRSLGVDYGRRGFFADYTDLHWKGNYRWGLFLQCVAAHYGQGRVIAFGDSTIFSNFYLFMPGVAEFAVRTVQWLNRVNPRPTLSWLGVFLFLLGAAVILWAARCSGLRCGPWCALGLTVGVSGAVWCRDRVNALALPNPPYLERPVTVAFERDHSQIFLPDEGYPDAAIHGPRDYQTFYVWTQRLDLRPRAYPTLARALQDTPDLLVLVNPAVTLTPTEASTIARYLQAGGRLLLLVGGARSETDLRSWVKNRREPNRTFASWRKATNLQAALQVQQVANKLLAACSPLRVSLAEARPSLVRTMDGRITYRGTSPGQVQGAAKEEVLLQQADGRPVSAVHRVGKGLILVFADSYSFTSSILGTVSTRPTEEQRMLAEVEFMILKLLVGGKAANASPRLEQPTQKGGERNAQKPMDRR